MRRRKPVHVVLLLPGWMRAGSGRWLVRCNRSVRPCQRHVRLRLYRHQWWRPSASFEFSRPCAVCRSTGFACESHHSTRTHHDLSAAVHVPGPWRTDGVRLVPWNVRRRGWVVPKHRAVYPRQLHTPCIGAELSNHGRGCWLRRAGRKRRLRCRDSSKRVYAVRCVHGCQQSERLVPLHKHLPPRWCRWHTVRQRDMYRDPVVWVFHHRLQLCQPVVHRQQRELLPPVRQQLRLPVVRQHVYLPGGHKGQPGPLQPELWRQLHVPSGLCFQLHAMSHGVHLALQGVH